MKSAQITKSFFATLLEQISVKVLSEHLHNKIHNKVKLKLLNNMIIEFVNCILLYCVSINIPNSVWGKLELIENWWTVLSCKAHADDKTVVSCKAHTVTG